MNFITNSLHSILHSPKMSAALSLGIGAAIATLVNTPAGFLGGAAFLLGTEVMRLRKENLSISNEALDVRLQKLIAVNELELLSDENVKLRFKIQGLERDGKKLLEDNDDLLACIREEKAKRDKTVDHLLAVVSSFQKK